MLEKCLKNAKVAVLHPRDHNPNMNIDTFAYVNGYCTVNFISTTEAISWLTGGLN